jgi:hypothetical protein
MRTRQEVCGQPSTPGAFGLTPLHLAVACDDEGQCVRLLTGSLPAILSFFSAKADDRHTPADYAAECPERSCISHDLRNRMVRFCPAPLMFRLPALDRECKGGCSRRMGWDWVGSVRCGGDTIDSLGRVSGRR